MQDNNFAKDNQIEEIDVILNELKKEQLELSATTQKNFEVVFKKLKKIIEYNEISDMTNQVFEMRLSNIEDFLFVMEQYIRNKRETKA